MPWRETNAAGGDVETVASAWRTNAAGDDVEVASRAWITNPAGDDVELFYSRELLIRQFDASGIESKPPGYTRCTSYIFHAGGGADVPATARLAAVVERATSLPMMQVIYLTK